MATICKHPKVRIVSRHEDTEFVECLECGEVFDSDEFRDMELEETAEPEEAETNDKTGFSARFCVPPHLVPCPLAVWGPTRRDAVQA